MLSDLGLILLIVVISTFFVWLPFVLGIIGNGMLTVFANYDGPNYLIIAKTLYNKPLIGSAFPLMSPPEYFPAHLPAYPLFIHLLNFFLIGPWAMLSVTLLSSLFAVSFFYLLLKKFRLSGNPLWLSVCFLFLPARWLVVRTVGSPEPLFIGAILASLYFFKSAFDKPENNLIFKKKSITLDFFLAGIFGGLAFITKTPGVLLFISYLIFLVYDFIKTKSFKFQAWPLLLIPFSILPVFLFYQIQTGDFFAYFHSGDNFHLFFPPFQSFNSQQFWVGDFWLEDLVYVYLFGALTVVLLIKQKLYDLAIFALVFFSATLFVAHRDLARYSLPLMPFSLIAFSKFMETKEFKIVFVFILIPIFLYTINFILNNTAPIAVWKPYL
jgi:hypothetical protein